MTEFPSPFLLILNSQLRQSRLNCHYVLADSSRPLRRSQFSILNFQFSIFNSQLALSALNSFKNSLMRSSQV